MPHSLIMAGPAILAFSRSKPSAIIANRHQQVSQKWNGRSRAVSTSRVILISFSLTSRLDPALAFNYALFLQKRQVHYQAAAEPFGVRGITNSVRL